MKLCNRNLLQPSQIRADVVTCPLSAITASLKYFLTDSSLVAFLADAKSKGFN